MGTKEILGRQRGDAYEGIIDLAVQGDLWLGEKTSEITIAEKLEMSRTPIREALAVLKYQGIVEQRPQVGVWIKKVMAEEMAQLTQVSYAVKKKAMDSFVNDSNGDYFEVLRPSLEQILVMADSRRSEDRLAQDRFLKAESASHENIVTEGIGTAGGQMVALWGLKRRLFHLENPLDIAAINSILASNVKFTDALLQARFKDAHELLEDYHTTQLILIGAPINMPVNVPGTRPLHEAWKELTDSV
ncbi:hypothetical protein BVY00_02290 [bacterium G20]|nr:hypothetical protein BVY00_02290 [bacterium G20]